MSAHRRLLAAVRFHLVALREGTWPDIHAAREELEAAIAESERAIAAEAAPAEPAYRPEAE